MSVMQISENHINSVVNFIVSVKNDPADQVIATGIQIMKANISAIANRYPDHSDNWTEEDVDQFYNIRIDPKYNISPIQCLKCIHFIDYQCDESPTWENSHAHVKLNEWEEFVVLQVFNSICDMAPSKNNSYYSVWIGALSEAIRCTPEYQSTEWGID